MDCDQSTEQHSIDEFRRDVEAGRDISWARVSPFEHVRARAAVGDVLSGRCTRWAWRDQSSIVRGCAYTKCSGREEPCECGLAAVDTNAQRQQRLPCGFFDKLFGSRERDKKAGASPTIPVEMANHPIKNPLSGVTMQPPTTNAQRQRCPEPACRAHAVPFGFVASPCRVADRAIAGATTGEPTCK